MQGSISTNLSTKLLPLLISPDDRSELVLQGDSLISQDSGKTYAVVDGIPLLYPETVDREHLAEELELAKQMKRSPSSSTDTFSLLEQWPQWKARLWEQIQAIVDREQTAKTIVYIGAGYDKQGDKFEQQGHTFVSFDLIYEMLKEHADEGKGSLFVAGDMNALPFKESVFDYIILIDVIHHECEDLQPILTSLHRILKPGGSLLLADVNAWGLFQWHKSLLLPRPLYRSLRSTYHRLIQSSHKPADYEFPTSPKQVKQELTAIGFQEIVFYPQSTFYPEVAPMWQKFYSWLSQWKRISTYHNYHYFLSAKKI
jgi:SAM-dependent methyltransferase